MITRNGVCYDLTISPYQYKIDNLIYMFSSKAHLVKFKKKHLEHRDIINYSLSKRFNMKVDVSQLADIVLYKKIETRGFLIVTCEGNNLWQNNIILNGKGVTIVD